MAIYKQINPIERAGSEPLNELKIKVAYTKGGYNSKRGIYAYIIPVHRQQVAGGNIESCTLLGEVRECGFKVCLREMARKSQKTEDQITAAVESQADKIVEHWNNSDYHAISRLLLTTTAQG